MRQNSTVLLLVHNADEREAVSRRLADLDVTPIVVHADRAVDAVERYCPIAAVLDQAHASTAPDRFLAVTSSKGVRLLTLSYPLFGAAISAAMLGTPGRADAD